MELKPVDPRTLIENPDNPRRKSPPDQADLQMTASIRAVGVLQPPVVREVGDKLMIRLGHRRVRGAIAAGKTELDVLVLGEAEHVDDDQLRAMVENTVRKPMSAVEQWHAIETLVSERWTEEAIATVLALPVRTLRKLRLLGRIHPPMLDRMHAGDMPQERDLYVIASASLDEQAAAWKKGRPRKGEDVSWWQLAQALTRRRMRAADAKFDADFAAAYGVEYTEDLFAPADEDSRTTTNVEGFLAAQHAWVEANLPADGVMLQTEQCGSPKLPPRTQRFYGKPGTGGESIGFYVNDGTGDVRTVLFTVPAPATAARGRGKEDRTTESTPAMPAKARASVTQKGEAMIGDMRTDALHAALRDEPIDDARLIALLVLAFAGNNVEVKTGLARGGLYGDGRAAIAGTLTEGEVITSDPAAIRGAARAMLAYTLSCRDNWSQSGAVARIAGDAIGADSHLPNMATQEFLSALSKAAVEGVAIGLNVPVQPTGKATRGAVIARVGEGRWVYPQALFGGAAQERAAQVARICEDAGLDQAADEPKAGEDSSVTPGDITGDGPLDDTGGVQRPDDMAEGDLPDADGPKPGNGAEAGPGLDADLTSTAPARRHRPRKDDGEALAAA